MHATSQDYLAQLQALLPSGAAWSREADAVLTLLLLAYADELARSHNRSLDLIEESDPRATSEMLTDWERVAGLPLDCLAAIDQSVPERRDAVVAQITSMGGQSRQFFIDLAKTIGFDVTITEFRPFKAGSKAGDTCADTPWTFTWRVNAPAETFRPFKAGQSVAGESLRTWGNDLLECVINRVKPTHTHLQFGYGS